MTRLATSWLVYHISHSAWMLGFVGFLGQIPATLLGPISGVIVDRFDRHKLLVITQALALVQSAALAVLTFMHLINIPEIIGLSIFQGIINSLDMPARQSFVIQMVEKKEDLSNAIALNSSLVNAGRLLGPSIGGVIIAAAGEGWCFLIDAISYIAVIVSLLLMTIKPKVEPAKGTRPAPIQQLVEGWRYVSGYAPIRTILLLLAVVSLVGTPYTVLMPVMASGILHGGPDTLGLMMAAVGVGALFGALYLASRKTVLGLVGVIPKMSFLFGAGLILFAFSHWIWLSMIVLILTGFGFMVQMAASNTVLQTIVEEEKRGRVMSFYTLALMGTLPFGSLLAGSLAEHIGAPRTLAFGGVALIVAGLIFTQRLPNLRRTLRPLYVQLGILPAPVIES